VFDRYQQGAGWRQVRRTGEGPSRGDGQLCQGRRGHDVHGPPTNGVL